MTAHKAVYKENNEPEFLETVLLQDGEFPLLDGHLQRMRRTSSVFFGAETVLFPEDLRRRIPEDQQTGRCKCRILYGREIHRIEFQTHEPRPLRTLRWIDAPCIDYRFKYADRCGLEALRAQRGGCDDILIGQDGFVTDTSYSNVALWDGDFFYTPEHCLLDGIRRHRLIETGRIRVMPVKITDLPAFERLYVINAMLGLEDGIFVNVSDIIK